MLNYITRKSSPQERIAIHIKIPILFFMGNLENRPIFVVC